MTTIEYHKPNSLIAHIVDTYNDKPETGARTPLTKVQMLIAMGSVQILAHYNDLKDNTLDNTLATVCQELYNDGELKANGSLNSTLLAIQLRRYAELRGTKLGTYFAYLMYHNAPVIDVREMQGNHPDTGPSFSYTFTSPTTDGQPISSRRSSWLNVYYEQSSEKEELYISTIEQMFNS